MAGETMHAGQTPEAFHIQRTVSAPDRSEELFPFSLGRQTPCFLHEVRRESFGNPGAWLPNESETPKRMAAATWSVNLV